MARCRKPPAFARWYWRPASSSKRRISIMVLRSSRQVPSSGSFSLAAAPSVDSAVARAELVLLRATGSAYSGRKSWSESGRRSSHRLLEAIVAPEELVSHGDRRYALDTTGEGLVGGRP